MNHELTVRTATTGDIDVAMQMYAHSRSLMRADGNWVQWVGGYPSRAQLEEDIACGSAFVVVRREQAVGVFSLLYGAEPTYAHIERGRWLDTESPYATMHRLACLPNQHGIAQTALAYAKRQFDHLRVDTHESNRAMRHIFEREGFVHCGTVLMADGTERLAYEWWRWDEVEPSLLAYVQRYVLPRYDHFDAAHSRSHALRVIARAMLMRRREAYALLHANIVYTTASMHDIGLGAGRERHHVESALIVRRSHALPRWFSPAEVILIADACEDHRASRGAPRTLLGRVVAEADRDVEPLRIVQRTVLYGLEHYPSLSLEEHWQRTLQHLSEKYAEGGYLRLWLDDSPNAEPLAELRSLIADHHRLRALFEHYFNNKQT